MILMGAGDTVGHKGEEVLCCQLRLFMLDKSRAKGQIDRAHRHSV